MATVTFTAPNGSWVRVDPEVVESVRPAVEGVHVRLLNGVTQIVRAPYLQVLEQLALR
jgi:uncharacterized protein YlzI (FlbEa/FlbD family)